MNTHLAFMHSAIALSEKGLGRTAPNPIVGAIIIGANGSVVAEGFHDRQSSADHAEVVALKIAGDRARGARRPSTSSALASYVGATGVI